MTTHPDAPTAPPQDTFELRLAIARHHAGRRIRGRGLSAAEAAQMVGVSGQTWRNWEAGDSAGARRPAMLRYIADRLGVPAEWLRDGGPLSEPSGPDRGPGLHDVRSPRRRVTGEGSDECAIRDSNPEPAD